MSAPEDLLALHLKAHKIPFEREVMFAKPRKWRADFRIAPDLLVEVDGGIWRKGGGAHSRPANIVRDIEKLNAGVMLGYRTLRFTPEMVQQGLAIEMICEAIR
jgi:very-short-patch-repair endonuclease